MKSAEELRLSRSAARDSAWRRWGPYLSERAWGTVREDYSAEGCAWDYFPHDQARSRAFRWSEDGICGISDRKQHVCFALAFWNGKDPILKERLFGLTGQEGNHGEDVKELYYYLDSTPTHSYMKMLYKYPQAEYPYRDLVEENRRRDHLQPEYELLDTGIFDENRYFDIEVQYAKAAPEDILIKVKVSNRGPEAATLHLLPTIWFRNIWIWNGIDERSSLYEGPAGPVATIEVDDINLGRRRLYMDSGPQGAPELLFTENETNTERLFNSPNKSPYVKDGINDYIVHGKTDAVNPEKRGTKASAHYLLRIEGGDSIEIRLRLTDDDLGPGTNLEPFGKHFEEGFEARLAEADGFYATVIPEDLSDDGKNVMRQALGGMLCSKQYYHYVVAEWLNGDQNQPPPPPERLHGRNCDWQNMYCSDIISMPDKWEYPWFAAWDLAFHCLAISIVDSDFAKEQLILLLREWYMHPSGQLPAYEWAFGDVNPPVHAWAALRVFRIERKRRGVGDYQFLKRVFHKLSLNFTWWVNRKDASGKNLFQGGFLGLDNIGVFDRSSTLPMGGTLEQSDGTAWMATYCLNLMAIALELSAEDPSYEDVASKFWEHFTNIAKAMSALGGHMDLWDDDDGFFYDVLCLPNGEKRTLQVRSMVGLIPLFAVETLEPEQLGQLKEFRERLEWFIDHRPDITANVASMRAPGHGERRLLSVVNEEKLRAVLSRMLDENEFLSDYGIRSVSKIHKDHPYTLELDGHSYSVDYEPGESLSGLFGGNSNWRGPIWFPPNYLLVESLQKFHWYFGDDFKVECPTGSGNLMNLNEVASELSRRLSRLFLADENGRRPVHGEEKRYAEDPHWKDLVLFYEYFHGDNGRGVGASHQTGWTGVVAKLLQQSGD